MYQPQIHSNKLERRQVERGQGESNMKVLVSAASKHGATSDIAEEIGKTLCEALRDRDVGIETT